MSFMRRFRYSEASNGNPITLRWSITFLKSGLLLGSNLVHLNMPVSHQQCVEKLKTYVVSEMSFPSTRNPPMPRNCSIYLYRAPALSIHCIFWLSSSIEYSNAHVLWRTSAVALSESGWYLDRNSASRTQAHLQTMRD
jgi:hypothetical protein